MIAKPDPATFQILPWRAEAPGHGPDVLRHPHAGRLARRYADPRYVLKRALAKASDLGFTFYTHPEIEFFLLKDKPLDGAPPDPGRRLGGYFDHTPHERRPRTSAARRSRCWSRWASRSSSATTRARPASRRSTCATPTRSPPPTTS